MSNSSEAPTAPITSLVRDLDRLAADVMVDWKVPGAALALVQDGKVVLTRAYGQRDLEAGLPVTPATQFAILSITKSFTATALALLHHEGRLDWSKPVRDYIPEFRLSDPVATERTTVLDLLCHRTGLPRHDWVHEPGDRTPAELLAVMQERAGAHPALHATKEDVPSSGKIVDATQPLVNVVDEIQRVALGEPDLSARTLI